jgi:hypothetical protein
MNPFLAGFAAGVWLPVIIYGAITGIATLTSWARGRRARQG